MKQKDIPFSCSNVSPPEGVEALDNIVIMISPRSKGTLNAGEYSKINLPPKINIVISATNKTSVKWECINTGSAEKYNLIYEVSNYNDSPAFAHLEILSK